MHIEKCLPLTADVKQEGKEREAQEVCLYIKQSLKNIV